MAKGVELPKVGTPVDERDRAIGAFAIAVIVVVSFTTSVLAEPNPPTVSTFPAARKPFCQEFFTFFSSIKRASSVPGFPANIFVGTNRMLTSLRRMNGFSLVIVGIFSQPLVLGSLYCQVPSLTKALFPIRAIPAKSFCVWLVSGSPLSNRLRKRFETVSPRIVDAFVPSLIPGNIAIEFESFDNFGALLLIAPTLTTSVALTLRPPSSCSVAVALIRKLPFVRAVWSEL